MSLAPPQPPAETTHAASSPTSKPVDRLAAERATGHAASPASVSPAEAVPRPGAIARSAVAHLTASAPPALPSAAADAIAPSARAAIEARLGALEAQHDIRILYACESGSRAWDFASSQSDYDVRFIYAHKLAWYLQVSPQRDVIETPIADGLDIQGWELRKARGLIKKGNGTVNDWLASPMTYRQDADFVAALGAAMQATFVPERASQHYLHLARGTLQKHTRQGDLTLKKVPYALRPLLQAMWIEQGLGAPPMALETLVGRLVESGAVKQAIGQLLAAKRADDASHTEAPSALLTEFMQTEIARLLAKTKATPAIGDPDDAALNQLVLDTVVRLT